MYFLGMLSSAKRLAIIGRALEATRVGITAAEQGWAERTAAGFGDALQHLVSEGVLFELRARFEWLTWLKEEVSKLDNETRGRARD
jgi:hypothetical protein